MAVQYAWKCPQCATAIALAAKQAGQDLVCPGCAASLSIPKLGVIKSLPVVGGSEPVTAKPRSGGVPVKSWLFAGGLLLAVLGIVAGSAAQYRANQYRVEVDLDAVMESEYEAIDEQPPAQIYAIAVSATDESFALEYSEPLYRSRNIKSGIIQKVAWVCWGMAGLGLLMLFGSFAFRS